MTSQQSISITNRELAEILTPIILYIQRPILANTIINDIFEIQSINSKLIEYPLDFNTDASLRISM